eukprot:15468405-Alexandrium_andersonii.AAC.1
MGSGSLSRDQGPAGRNWCCCCEIAVLAGGRAQNRRVLLHTCCARWDLWALFGPPPSFQSTGRAQSHELVMGRRAKRGAPSAGPCSLGSPAAGGV